MSIFDSLQQRGNHQCELCGSSTELATYVVAPKPGDSSDDCVLVCGRCNEQLSGDVDLDVTHWRCLNDSMWSTVAAVQVLSYQQLTLLTENGETWAQDLLDMLYLEDDAKSWADAGVALRSADGDDEAIDSNGDVIKPGDNVYIIKDLPVKGTGFTAKQGTAVRNVSITASKTHVEGKVNGQTIQIITKFVKKM